MEFLEVSSKFISQYSFSHLMKMGDTSSDSDGINYKKNAKDALRVVVNFLIAFFIFHKNGVKTFLKWIVNHCLKGTR